MPIHSRLSYLNKHRFAPRQILQEPDPQLGLTIVIPSHCEPDLDQTLASLAACALPSCAVAVIVVLNASERASERVRELNTLSREKAGIALTKAFIPKQMRFHWLNFPALPAKHAGVGLARKIGMDEAADQLERAGNPEGIILCLDADSLVAPDYLAHVYEAFQKQPKAEAASIYFEHPVSGEAFEADIYRGIVRYELFLRYYVQALRYAGYPHAMHTVGSSMAVRANAYQAKGGMNRRKAGEDFYFLHKFIPDGKVIEIQTTTVIPSPRPAEKVPFGTGKSVQNWLDGDRKTWPVYSPRIFEDLRAFTGSIASLYDSPPPPLPDPVQAFLDNEAFDQKLPEIRKHVASREAFIKRFYQWFDGLKVLKYVHFARDGFYANVDVIEAAAALWGMAGKQKPTSTGNENAKALQWLQCYRDWDRGV